MIVDTNPEHVPVLCVCVSVCVCVCARVCICGILHSLACDMPSGYPGGQWWVKRLHCADLSGPLKCTSRKMFLFLIWLQHHQAISHLTQADKQLYA